jgi:hypothetical protein
MSVAVDADAAGEAAVDGAGIVATAVIGTDSRSERRQCRRDAPGTAGSCLR